MSESGEVAHRRAMDLTREECWRLIGTESVGRIAWATSGQPFLVPVNFAVEGTTIYVHTSPYATLMWEVDDTRVAFQVDDIDSRRRLGWTVTAQGWAELRLAGSGISQGPDVDVWVAGAKTATVAIKVDQVSGRRLTGSPQ